MAVPIDLVAFQRLNVGPDGKRLLDDGILGPKTRWALALAELPRWRQDVVLGALRWLGVGETGGDNRGPEIDAWLAACGVQPGNPWCAAFYSALLRAAGIEMRQARVSELAKRLEPVAVPLPGDAGYIIHPDGSGHIGAVIAPGWPLVALCEGNTRDLVRVGTRATAGLSFGTPRGYGLPALPAGLLPLGGSTR